MSEEKIEAPQPQKVLGDKILGAHNNPTKDSIICSHFGISWYLTQKSENTVIISLKESLVK